LTVVVVCYAMTLLRSDRGHFMNLMVGLPLFIAFLITEPSCLINVPGARRSLHQMFLLVVLLMIFGHQWISSLIAPAQRFFESGIAPSSAVYSRVGAEKVRVGATVRLVPIGELMPELAAIKTIVGENSVFFESFPVSARVIYFLGDFRPPPFPLDRDTMIVNDRLVEANLVEMRQKLDKFDFIITEQPETEFVKVFRNSKPQARTYVRRFQDRNYFIIGQLHNQKRMR
jgi:hypothetical protein